MFGRISIQYVRYDIYTGTEHSDTVPNTPLIYSNLPVLFILLLRTENIVKYFSEFKETK